MCVLNFRHQQSTYIIFVSVSLCFWSLPTWRQLLQPSLLTHRHAHLSRNTMTAKNLWTGNTPGFISSLRPIYKFYFVWMGHKKKKGGREGTSANITNSRLTLTLNIIYVIQRGREDYIWRLSFQAKRRKRGGIQQVDDTHTKVDGFPYKDCLVNWKRKKKLNDFQILLLVAQFYCSRWLLTIVVDGVWIKKKKGQTFIFRLLLFL